MRLRPFRATDFKTHQAYMAKVFEQGFLGAPLTEEDLWRRIISSVGMWDVVGFGGWMAERKDDSRVIGNVGLFVAPRALEPSFEGQPEMGWIFDPEVHGQGYAIEACRAVAAWADEVLGLPIWAIISPGNEASYRIADKLGFERLGDTPYNGEPITVLRRPAPAR